MDESVEESPVKIREFKANLHHALSEAMKSDNPMLAALVDLPEFQKQLAEQTEMLAIVNLRRKLSVADELVDAAVEEIMDAAMALSAVLLKHVKLSKATSMRTLEIDTPSGHMKILFNPPMGRGKF